MERLLDEVTYLGNKAVEAHPACRAEGLAKEHEKRMRIVETVMQLTNIRISFFD